MELPETEHVSDVEWGRSCMILQGAGFLKVSNIVLILLQHVIRVRLLFVFQYSIKLFSKYFIFIFSINIGILCPGVFH